MLEIFNRLTHLSEAATRRLLVRSTQSDALAMRHFHAYLLCGRISLQGEECDQWLASESGLGLYQRAKILRSLAHLIQAGRGFRARCGSECRKRPRRAAVVTLPDWKIYGTSEDYACVGRLGREAKSHGRSPHR